MFSIISAIGVPVVTCRPLSSSNTPERIFTSSASRRWVVKRDWPGLRLSRKTLDLCRRQRNARRAAVDDRAERRPVALAKGGDAEEMAESIVRHGGIAPLEGSAFVRRGREGVKRTTRNPPIVAAARRRY